MPPQIVHRESFSCRANFSTERAPKAPTINMLGLHMPFHKVSSQRCKAALKTLPFTSESLLHILQDQFIQPYSMRRVTDFVLVFEVASN